MRCRFLLFRINLDHPIRNPLNEICIKLFSMYFLTKKKCQFLLVLVKKSNCHVTKGVKRLFLQLLISFTKHVVESPEIVIRKLQTKKHVFWPKMYFFTQISERSTCTHLHHSDLDSGGQI